MVLFNSKHVIWLFIIFVCECIISECYFADKISGECTSTNKVEEENQRDRLIQLGEMTPFGTMIKNNEADKSEKKEPQPCTSQMSEFEKFLSTKDLPPTAKSVNARKTSYTSVKPSFKTKLQTSIDAGSFEKPSNMLKQNGMEVDKKKDREVHSWENGQHYPQNQHIPPHNVTENNKLSENENTHCDNNVLFSSDDEYVPDKLEWKMEYDSDEFEEVGKFEYKNIANATQFTECLNYII